MPTRRPNFSRTMCFATALLSVSAWNQSSSSPANGGASFGAEIESLCPEAVREAAALRARAARPEVHAPPSRPALRENLLLMAKQDQEARKALGSSGLHLRPGSPEIKRMHEVDSTNLKRLKHIVTQDGFPTAEMVGLEGVDAAWLLTIHAASDPNFQEKVLKLAEPQVRRGEVSGDQVALLTDDILSGRGRPQRYGTNFVLRDGELKPAPMEDEANVDRRRQALGMISLASYACIQRATHGSPSPQAANPSGASR